MKIKSFFFILLNVYVFIGCKVLADGLFSASTSQLYAPYVQYQQQLYSLEFILSGNELQLNNVRLRNNQPVYGEPSQVDQQLNINLTRVSYNGSLYDLGLQYINQNRFAVTAISNSNVNIGQRGQLISFESLGNITRLQMNTLAAAYNLQNGTQISHQPSHDIELFRVTYHTLDPGGDISTASALIVLPLNSSQPLPLIAYQHGTEVKKDAVPSEQIYDLPSLFFASSGYVVAAADFLGLGSSTINRHPYVHAHSLATSIIDALRSARQLAPERSIVLNNQLFLLGYSEGGYATMAAHREIQHHYNSEFAVTASAPMAGPYDLSGTMLEIIFAEQAHPNPYYFPYMLLAFNDVYGLSDDLADFFQSPYDSSIPPLYLGQNSGSQINAALPENNELYNPELLQSIRLNSFSWLTESLYENDLYRWVPQSAMYLYHCTEDEQVPFENSQIAYDYFQNQGATQVQLISLESPENSQPDIHSNCVVPAIIAAKAVFDSLVR